MGFDGFEDDWYWFWYEEAWEGNEKVPFPTDDVGNHIDNKKRDSKPCISTEERQRDEYSKKAWDFYMDFKEEDALHYINLALDLDKSDSNNWNIKAIILEGMKRYKESEYCYDISLNLSFQNLVCDNKVRMLYDWASKLIEEAKKLPNGLKKLEEAKEINIRAINSRPGENSEEDLDKYLHQRDAINSYINQEKEYQRNLETLKRYSKDELFTIAGNQFYDNNLAPGRALKLVKEPYNEFDRDAIAVFADNEKIGYVANNDNTKHESTSSASQLHGNFKNIAQGQYLFYLQRHEIQFHIGRIIK